MTTQWRNEDRHRRTSGVGQAVLRSLSTLKRGLTIGALVVFSATPCLAHHSFSIFDQNKSVTLKGTVKELQWTNPHCYIQLLVPFQGTTAEWNIEMHSPLGMYRYGWRPGSFKPGDKITVVINPLKDGSNGGRLLVATDASGRSLGTDGSETAAGPRS
jgi:hypothetical protein